MTLTLVALLGPELWTVMTYVISSPILASVVLTVLLMLKSTTGWAVTFSLLSLLGSVSLLLIIAVFSIFQSLMILAIIVITTLSSIARLPIVTTPEALSYVMSLRDASNEINWLCRNPI
ncbi:hypothetical protein [Methanobrevibacter sp.]|uniref:hypothetical protein n=1 Tax=Methanobrevibacter sp. TaxID=66852 RepID=UPI00388E295E